MIDQIGTILAMIMGASALIMCSFFVLAVERARENPDEDDRVFDVYWLILKVSSIAFILSWLTIMVLGPISSITR